MAPRESSHEPTSTPDPVEKGFATLATLRYVRMWRAIWGDETDQECRIGVKAFVEKVCISRPQFSCNIRECRMDVNLAATFDFLKSYFWSFSFSLNIINSRVQLLLKESTFTSILLWVSAISVFDLRHRMERNARQRSCPCRHGEESRHSSEHLSMVSRKLF